MRLLETLLFPPDYPGHINSQIFLALSATSYRSVGDYGDAPVVNYSGGIRDYPSGSKKQLIPLPQPRLGRSWGIERVTITPVYVASGTNPVVTPKNFSIETQLLLNQIAVSDTVILSFSTPGDINGDILTPQVKPITLTPYQDIQQLSGDNLSVSMFSDISTPLAAGASVSFFAAFSIAVIGENQAFTLSRS